MIKVFKKHQTILLTGLSLLLVIGTLTFCLLSLKNHAKDFSQGMIVINTDKPIYRVGESVNIALGSLDQSGVVICDSDLVLKITTPQNQVESLPIIHSPTCGKEIITSDPDYFSTYVPQELGKYTLELTNQDLSKSITSYFEIKDQVDIDVKRSSASRLDRTKPNRYPMIITITSAQDYQGIIEEQLPKSFDIVWYGSATVNQDRTHQSLTWQVNLKRGESIDLKYEYSAPQTEPELFTFGPIKTKSQTISSYWRVM